MQDEKIDVGDSDEQATEIDLDAPAPEQSLEEEIKVEQVEDDNQPANASEEASEQSDVQASEQKKELDDYSEGVQKRIAKLTRKMREAERQKEEAIKYAEQIKSDAEKLKTKHDTLGDSYTKELESKVTTGMNAAKIAYKQAIEAQDVEGQVEAQKAIAQMAMEEARLNNLKQAQEERSKQIDTQKEQIVPQTADPVAQAQQQIDPKAQNWATKNSWFGTDNAMTYTAFDIHRKLVEEEGYDPQSNDYYVELDRRIKLEFPHKFGKTKEVTTKPTQTVASATRGGKKAGRRTVQLTSSQVAIARKLNVPLEEYAKQINIEE